ncbi:MAG: hypothetical protein EOP07_17325 [Proteobacteria bacterium]|nr:MAG: hypothetical protein EOP07_17325 [Pseudomonadota bacterium]
MKNLTNQSWILKSSALALGLNLFTGCGTEIGNGRKPPVLPEGTKAGNTTPNAYPAPDESAGEPTSTNPEAEDSALEAAFDYLFIACGSPIPDLIAGNYLESVGSKTLKILVPAAGSWTVSIDSDSYLIQRNTSASSQYAIKSSSVTLGSQTCSQPTTVVNGSETEKSIVYSDNYKTTWILDGNSKVTNIKVLDPNGVTVRDWTAQ